MCILLLEASEATVTGADTSKEGLRVVRGRDPANVHE